MKYILCIAATLAMGASVASAQYPGQYGGQSRTQSVIRPVGHHAGHAALWNDYGSTYGGGPSCGCAAPAPSCGCAAPVPSCGSCCRPCCPPILSVIPCAIKKFGRTLDCLLPCNKKCCGGCGIGFGHGGNSCGCSSCSTGCSSCSSGVPDMGPYSDPFIDDPVQPMSTMNRYAPPSPPVPPKDVRRSPVRSSPLASQPIKVQKPAYEPRQINVASHTVRPIPATRQTAAAPVRESSVLKRISLEAEIEPAYEAAPAPPSYVAPASPRLMQQFDVPVNPLR